MRCIQWN